MVEERKLLGQDSHGTNVFAGDKVKVICRYEDYHADGKVAEVVKNGYGESFELEFLDGGIIGHGGSVDDGSKNRLYVSMCKVEKVADAAGKELSCNNTISTAAESKQEEVEDTVLVKVQNQIVNRIEGYANRFTDSIEEGFIVGENSTHIINVVGRAVTIVTQRGDDGELKQGFSICNPKDIFNLEKGIELAKERLQKKLDEVKVPEPPKEVKPFYPKPGETFYFVNVSGSVGSDEFDDKFLGDIIKVASEICFASQEDAELSVPTVLEKYDKLREEIKLKSEGLVNERVSAQ